MTVTSRIRSYFVCESVAGFLAEVKGSGGEPYTVQHGPEHQFNDVMFDFSCTCPSYTFKKKKGERYCKHIRTIIDQGVWCGWDQYKDGGDPIGGCCPRCGREVVEILYYID